MEIKIPDFYNQDFYSFSKNDQMRFLKKITNDSSASDSEALYLYFQSVLDSHSDEFIYYKKVGTSHKVFFKSEGRILGISLYQYFNSELDVHYFCFSKQNEERLMLKYSHKLWIYNFREDFDYLKNKIDLYYKKNNFKEKVKKL